MKRLVTSFLLIGIISFSGFAFTPVHSAITPVEAVESGTVDLEKRKVKHKRKAFKKLKKAKKIKVKQMKKIKRIIKKEIH